MSMLSDFYEGREKSEINSFNHSIEEAKRRYNNQVQKVADEQYIEKLLYIDYVDRVKSLRSQWDVLPDALKHSFHYISNKKENRAYKSDYDFTISSIIENMLNGKKITVKEIVCAGYLYYYHILFTFNDDEKKEKTVYAISIPQRKHINVDNFDSAEKGKFVLYEVKNHLYNRLAEGYFEQDILEYVKEHF